MKVKTKAVVVRLVSQHATVTLDAVEADTLLHRLEMDDCYRDVFDDRTGEGSFMASIAETLNESIRNALNASGNCQSDVGVPDVVVTAPETHAVIVEAIEGSTWLAAFMSTSPALSDWNAARRAFRTLKTKIEVLTNRCVPSPVELTLSRPTYGL